MQETENKTKMDIPSIPFNEFAWIQLESILDISYSKIPVLHPVIHHVLSNNFNILETIINFLCRNFIKNIVFGTKVYGIYMPR